MSYRERDIKHDAPGGRYWVLDTGKAYAVMIVGVTHSTSDSAYERTPDGLSIAVARCNYLAATQAHRSPAKGSRGYLNDMGSPCTL